MFVFVPLVAVAVATLVVVVRVDGDIVVVVVVAVEGDRAVCVFGKLGLVNPGKLAKTRCGVVDVS